MQRIDRQDDGVPGVDRCVAKAVAGLGRARDDCRGWIKAQGLVNDLADIGQVGNAIPGWSAPRQDRLNLGAGAILNGGVEGAEIERPGQRQGGGFMPRHDECQQVVAQL